MVGKLSNNVKLYAIIDAMYLLGIFDGYFRNGSCFSPKISYFEQSESDSTKWVTFNGQRECNY